MRKLLDREYLTPARIVILILLIIAGLSFVVLDEIYHILPTINKESGQRTIEDLARSTFISLLFINTYFVFTRFREEEFHEKFRYFIKYNLISFCIICAMTFLFCLVALMLSSSPYLIR
jgi:hypothetical protein